MDGWADGQHNKMRHIYLCATSLICHIFSVLSITFFTYMWVCLPLTYLFSCFTKLGCYFYNLCFVIRQSSENNNAELDCC